MTTTLMLGLAMQFMVATKAGLVNYVQGPSNIVQNHIVAEGAPIRTGSNAYVELLLTPGSYMRIAGDSEVVLNNVALAAVAVTVVKGVAIVEIVDIDKKLPITVATGDLKVHLGSSGIYRFSDGRATVLDGKLRTIDPAITYKKGWQVAYSDGYRAYRVPNAELTALDAFSRRRSELIAAANDRMTNSISRTSYVANVPFWIFNPVAGFFTYIPIDNRRSPYGYGYRGLATAYYRQRTGADAASNSGGGVRQSNSDLSSPGNASSGGNFNGAGERTYSVPAGGDRVTAGEYQSTKNPSAPNAAP